MADIYDEHAECVESVVNSYRELRKLAPRHKLLGLAKICGVNLVPSKRFGKEYSVEEGGIGAKFSQMSRYKDALVKAVEEEKSLIPA